MGLSSAKIRTDPQPLISQRVGQFTLPRKARMHSELLQDVLLQDSPQKYLAPSETCWSRHSETLEVPKLVAGASQW